MEGVVYMTYDEMKRANESVRRAWENKPPLAQRKCERCDCNLRQLRTTNGGKDWSQRSLCVKCYKSRRFF
jgi:predicted lipoprotein with Yx(FWY)xxD motif